MRKSNTQSIRDILRDYVNDMGIERKLKEVDIVHAWENILGKAIASYTGRIYISKGVLYVTITSPVVKAELLMMREEIRGRLNDEAGSEIVEKIVFK
ncbi:hypothetical protein MNBD_BACTEROID01-1346 [hydrothermal vent metagenome]|uniref:Zn-ribbon-containing, possibly RNA-binding protein and truncated derivatives n=1 Tax=hydrothermal vent metagenome TaxID=652676 RepID=A0A3B0THG1_9ZZZZ